MAEAVWDAIKSADLEEKGHFFFASGLHSDTHIDMPKILNHPEESGVVKGELIDVLHDGIVIPVPRGGLEIAKAWLPDTHDVIPTSKLKAGVFVIYLGHNAVINSATDITIFEDVVTKGTSSGALGRAVRSINPSVRLHLVGILLGNEIAPENAAVFDTQTYLAEHQMPSWPAEECDLC